MTSTVLHLQSALQTAVISNWGWIVLVLTLTVYGLGNSYADSLYRHVTTPRGRTTSQRSRHTHAAQRTMGA